MARTIWRRRSRPSTGRWPQRIAVAPGERLLEIGSGWGGFAITAAKEFGAKVTSITVSRAQAEHARARVSSREGLGDRVEIVLQDYRDVKGQFDRIASIEMFEAVGERFWPTFFQGVRDRLRPGGLAGLQLITIADQYFDDYRRNADFIQTYVFPGGMLPSPAVLDRQARGAGLLRESERTFGACYARTLRSVERAVPGCLAADARARLRRALPADLDLLSRLLRGGLPHRLDRRRADGPAAGLSGVSRPTTATAGPLSWRMLLGYGGLALPLAALNLPLYVYLPTFYSAELGLDLATVGGVLLLARLFDTVIDPLMGELERPRDDAVRPASPLAGARRRPCCCSPAGSCSCRRPRSTRSTS